MFQLIAKLRQRPLADRRRIAFVVALSITILIAIMWIVWLSVGGITVRTGREKPVGGTPAESLWTPLKSAFIDFTKSVFK